MTRAAILALALLLALTMACSDRAVDPTSWNPEDPEPIVNAEPVAQTPNYQRSARPYRQDGIVNAEPVAQTPNVAGEDGCAPGTACARVPEWWDAHGEKGWVHQELGLDEPWIAEQRDATGRSLHPTLQQIATCLDALKTEQPYFRGRMDVMMTIANDGSVSVGRASTPLGGGFRECALAALSRIDIRAPTYLGEVRWGLELY